MQVIKEHKENKAMWDKEKAELQKQMADMRDKLLECSVSSKDQLSEMKKDMDELLQVNKAKGIGKRYKTGKSLGSS